MAGNTHWNRIQIIVPQNLQITLTATFNRTYCKDYGIDFRVRLASSVRYVVWNRNL